MTDLRTHHQLRTRSLVEATFWTGVNRGWRIAVPFMLLSVASCFATSLAAQNSSLLRAGPQPVDALPSPAAQPMPGMRNPMMQTGPTGSNNPMGMAGPGLTNGFQGVSWTYQKAPPLRAFQLHDIVTIRVDEIMRMQAEGETEKRRLSLFQATLSEWVRISQGKLIPDEQVAGDPEIDAQSQTNSRAEASIESRESLTFNIAARVVDIRPNGNLVLEARKSYRINDNLWETSLSGICRAQDIAPDNVVLSRDLIDLEIHKQDRGQLRDGYRRGWFQRFFERVAPF
ncbi:MAG: flagellar basal body L-ring protein FlgH [Planctomycetota bacterium]